MVAPHLTAVYEQWGRRPAWMSEAACLGEPPEIFFPAHDDDAELGKAICEGCPVKEDCLTYVLEHTRDATDAGVWGGTTEKERRSIRRRAVRARERARKAVKDVTPVT